MARILGNLYVAGNLTVDGTGGGLGRVKNYNNTSEGDLAIATADGDTQILALTGMQFHNEPGNEANGQNYYIVRGTFPIEQTLADGTTTFTFRVGTTGAIGDTIVYKAVISKDSARPHGQVSFNWLIQPATDYLIGVSCSVDAGTVNVFGDAANYKYCTVSIERII